MDLGKPFAVISPSVDGSALTVLAGADQGFTPPAVHRLAGEHSEDGIRRALERLTRQGIVIGTRVGNASTYRLNRRHLAADPIIAIARLRERFLRQTSDEIGSWAVPAVYAALFGSAARSTMRVDSDIDIFLVRPDVVEEGDAQWARQTEALAENAHDWTGNHVHILEFSEAETADNQAMKDSVLSNIETEGLAIHGPSRYLKRLRRRHTRG